MTRARACREPPRYRDPTPLSWGLTLGSRAATEVCVPLIMLAHVSTGLRTGSHPFLRLAQTVAKGAVSNTSVGAPVGEPPSGSRLTAIVLAPASAARCEAVSTR